MSHVICLDVLSCFVGSQMSHGNVFVLVFAVWVRIHISGLHSQFVI